MISVKHDVLDEESLYRLQQTLYSDRFMWIPAQTNKHSTNTYYVHEFRHVNGIASPYDCLLYTSPSPRDRQKSRMPSSA